MLVTLTSFGQFGPPVGDPSEYPPEDPCINGVSLPILDLVSGNLCLNQEFTIPGLNLNPDLTYWWDIPGAASENGFETADPGLIWFTCGSGTQTITLNARNASGCTGSTSVTVNIANCCVSDNPNYFDQTLGDLTKVTIITQDLIGHGKRYKVVGRLEISGNLKFQGSFFFDDTYTYNTTTSGGNISSNKVGLFVPTGNQLELDICTLKAYCTSMWDGVEVQDGAKLVYKGSGFETIMRDSWNGIYTTSGKPDLKIEKLSFINNRRGVSADLFQKGVVTYPAIKNCDFKSQSSGFFPPYDYCHNYGTYQDAGLYIGEFAIACTNSASTETQSTGGGPEVAYNCDINNFIFGAKLDEYTGPIRNSTFRNCQKAAIFGNAGASLQISHQILDGSTIIVPPSVAQTHQLLAQEALISSAGISDLGNNKIAGIYLNGPYEGVVQNNKIQGGVVSTSTLDQVGLRFAYNGEIKDNEFHGLRTAAAVTSVLNTAPREIHIGSNAFFGNQDNIVFKAGTGQVDLHMTCNLFSPGNIPSNKTYRGIVLESGFQGIVGNAIAATSGSSNVPVGNVFPVANTINRTVLPVTISNVTLLNVESPAAATPWISPNNWESVVNQTGTSITYNRYNNEFVGRTAGSSSVLKTPSNDFIITLANPPGTTGMPEFQFCSNLGNTIIYFPNARMGVTGLVPKDPTNKIPNPQYSGQSLQLGDIDGTADISVFGSNGQLLFTGNAKQASSLSLKQGIYLLRSKSQTPNTFKLVVL